MSEKHEVEKIFEDLPFGVWENPKPEDMAAYEEFVAAWNADDSQLYEQWKELDGTGTTLRALAYSCVTEGCDCTAGRFNKYDIGDSADDGLWEPKHTSGFDATHVEFGGTYIISSAEPIELPLAEQEAESVQAQDMGYHTTSAFLRFQNVTVPRGAVINYARLKFTAADNAIGDCSVLIAGGIPGGRPTTALQCNQWERTDNRKVWDIEDDWVWNDVYYSPNIACVIQELVDAAWWEYYDGDNALLFLDAYSGTSLKEAYDFLEDAGKSADLEIWWIMVYNESMTGGVKCNGAARNWMRMAETMQGGASLNGTADVSKVNVFNPAYHGKVLLGGSASVSVGLFMRGGIKLGGRATISTTIPMRGGVVASWRRFPQNTPFRQRIIVPEGAVGSYLEKFYLGIATTIRNPNLVKNGNFQVYSGTRLIASDVRSWDAATGKLVIFFKADLRADADNVFYLCYGV